LGIDKGFKSASYGYQDTDKSMGNGSAIYEYETVETVRKAVEMLNNFVLDKNHTFKAYTIVEYEDIIQTSEVFEPPISLPKKVLYLGRIYKPG